MRNALLKCYDYYGHILEEITSEQIKMMIRVLRDHQINWASRMHNHFTHWKKMDQCKEKTLKSTIEQLPSTEIK